MLSVHSCPIGKLGSRDTGGMSVYIREIARELGRRGHSVDIFTRAHDPEDALIYNIDENVRLVHLQVGEIEQMHKLVLYSHLADMACSVENFRKSDNQRYHLVHSHYWLSGWVGRRLRQWWNVPHITMFHTLAAVKNATGVGEEESELRQWNELELVAECDRIIASTECEKEHLIKWYDAEPGKVSVVPCGVNLSQFNRLDKESARQHLGFNGDGIVLFVGRVDPLKGIDRLIEAVPMLNSGRDMKLVVVGGDEESGPEVEKLRRLSCELQIQDSVTFAGTVKHQDLPAYYNAADVCVIPSYYESFGLVALESLACGTPVVAARVGGMEEVVRHGCNGCLAEDNMPANLASCINAVVSRRDDSTARADSIRKSVGRFGWSNVAQAIEKEYRAMLG